MSNTDHTIPVPTATLDCSVTYKDAPLKNCFVGFFGNGYDTGMAELGETGRRPIVVTLTDSDLTLRLMRKGQPDDAIGTPVLGGDFKFGPVHGKQRVLIVVAEPKP